MEQHRARDLRRILISLVEEGDFEKVRLLLERESEIDVNAREKKVQHLENDRDIILVML